MIDFSPLITLEYYIIQWISGSQVGYHQGGNRTTWERWDKNVRLESCLLMCSDNELVFLNNIYICIVIFFLTVSGDSSSTLSSPALQTGAASELSVTVTRATSCNLPPNSKYGGHSHDSHAMWNEVTVTEQWSTGLSSSGLHVEFLLCPLAISIQAVGMLGSLNMTIRKIKRNVKNGKCIASMCFLYLYNFETYCGSDSSQ